MVRMGSAELLGVIQVLLKMASAQSMVPVGAAGFHNCKTAAKARGFCGRRGGSSLKVCSIEGWLQDACCCTWSLRQACCK